jgi:hypothetical protein
VRVRVPVIVKDPEVTVFKQIPLTEPNEVEEDVFLDGPISSRVAILDFDPETGVLLPGIVLERNPAAEQGTYRVQSLETPIGDDLARVSVFGTIYKVVEMFEESDAIGRRIGWAFNGPQLLVMPRAGEWANAYYERESHSLQFFWFRPLGDPTVIVYTSHSQDIVAHEAAHAVLDGIAPDLYHALSPQSLAIHEAIADLTAVLASFRSRDLVESVLSQTNGSIQESHVFAGIAEQFGRAMDSGREYLRDLLNNKSLDPDDSIAANPGDPHDLSEVLSGALYTTLVSLHQQLKEELATKRVEELLAVEPQEAVAQFQKQGLEREPATLQAGPIDAMDAQASADLLEAKRKVSGKALFVATERFRRTLYRGLDYLPPGEVSFADLGRAILASDQASHPDTGQLRDWIRAEFLRRWIVRAPEELDVDTNRDIPAVSELDLEELVRSDWVAYDFANRNRELLGIPSDIPFKVLPRLDVEKEYWYSSGRKMVRECILKVSWTETEPNNLRPPFPDQRQIVVGTTLAIDWETKQVRAIITSEKGERQRASRDEFLSRLADDDVLQLGENGIGPSGRPLSAVILAEVIEGQMRVRGSARFLHLVPEG